MATITVRTDAEVDRALKALTEATGQTTADAIRATILDAYRNQYYARMRADAEAAVNDPEDRAGTRRVIQEMDGISAR
ncbi:hypothetical protein [Wenjunlia tyrosinilytica]|uniref:Ribbon-helix-helix protein CopG domain-containing protein n=1 Tax=Wenjunlia tyrosinilytica TaxID=1544741 RepID=A0A918E0T4_9ACTN|nr:hypothetical protein [Wenjunlia tyrosinilytica]GGO98204.1 hypothetical protein GCM10012280_61790 [Wenjunlia tyrosinilytica]